MQNLIIYTSPLITYLIGSIPFGFVLVKAIKGIDIREHGSKNVGATNAMRVAGKPVGIAAFILDMLKGFVPVLIVSKVYTNIAGTYNNELVLNKDTLAIICGIAAILGHIFPVYLKFKGGKAAATSCGVFLFLAPAPLAIAVVVWVITTFVSKFVSLGTMSASIAFAVSILLINEKAFSTDIGLSIFAIIMSVLIIILHKSNIKRIIKGTENKIGRKKKDNNE